MKGKRFDPQRHSLAYAGKRLERSRRIQGLHASVITLDEAMECREEEPEVRPLPLAGGIGPAHPGRRG